MDATTQLSPVIKVLQLSFLLIVISLGLSAQPVFNDDPAGPGEWGFRPHDGSISKRNPPGFSWRPQEGAHNYIFQVAKDVTFIDIVHEAQDIEYMVYCPPVTLPVEQLYWRVAFVGDNGQSNWSQ
ncbi:MAG: hypothetical protein PHH93_07860, partial [Prolixibacteraceae bacterium]|nr:hypothetical protein [Prolixibacteraceae bacterium]